tara:strand:+ start:35 stop:484 length:450 start_codon:yes stop_codon:yes gene_type:complete
MNNLRVPESLAPLYFGTVEADAPHSEGSTPAPTPKVSSSESGPSEMIHLSQCPKRNHKIVKYVLIFLGVIGALIAGVYLTVIFVGRGLAQDVLGSFAPAVEQSAQSSLSSNLFNNNMNQLTPAGLQNEPVNEETDGTNPFTFTGQLGGA